MALYAIADTHLSFGTDKPMDDFFGWNNYVERLTSNWKKLIEPDDTVIIAGDISWASDFEELKPDFEYINSLPGKKLIIKGNHDFWWNTMKKMNAFLDLNGFNSISFVYNNSVTVNNTSVCGSRGWFFDSEDDHSEKVLNREVGRIKASIESAECEEKIVFLHYPPLTQNAVCKPIIDLLHEKNITKCYYGHLHGLSVDYAAQGIIEGIDFRLISADKLSFTPLFIKK